MNKTILRNYAKLLARAGLNVRRGDEVIINAELDQPEFVEMVVRECYRAGAAKVTVEWSHQPLQKLGERKDQKSHAEIGSTVQQIPR